MSTIVVWQLYSAFAAAPVSTAAEDESFSRQILSVAV